MIRNVTRVIIIHKTYLRLGRASVNIHRDADIWAGDEHVQRDALWLGWNVLSRGKKERVWEEA